MYEDADPALPEGSLDHALLAIDEVLKARPKEAKAFYRKAQVLMLQQDLPGAREALDETKKLAAAGAIGSNLRDAYAKLKDLERKEHERQRQLYGGKLQAVSMHRMQADAEATALARQETLWKYVRIVGFPIVLPLEWLYALVSICVRAVRRQMGTTSDATM